MPNVKGKKWAIRKAEGHANTSGLRKESKMQQGFFCGVAVSRVS